MIEDSFTGVMSQVFTNDGAALGECILFPSLLSFTSFFSLLSFLCLSPFYIFLLNIKRCSGKKHDGWIGIECEKCS